MKSRPNPITPVNEPDGTGEPLRLGLIGAGSIGAAHANSARKVPGVTVGAVCDVNRDAANHVANDHRAAVFTDYRELLRSGLVNAVVISTPHSLHTEHVLASIAAGLHVLVEKPMAITTSDCDAMIKAAGEAGICLAVGHHQRYMHHMTVAERIITSGELGTPMAVLDNRTAPYIRGRRPNWFFSRELAGGGVLFNIGAHCIDRTLWLTRQRVESVSATLLYRGDFEVESDALVQLVLHNGTVAQITVTGEGTPSRDEIIIIGDAGVLTVSHAAGVLLHRGGVSETRYLADGTGTPSLVIQLREFARSVREDRPAVVDGAHGRAVVSAIQAAYESHQAKANGSGRATLIY